MVILAIRGSRAKNISMTTAIRDAKGKSGLASPTFAGRPKKTHNQHITGRPK